MNKIIFLGTGSASHLTRQMTAIVFVFGKYHILVDCGDGMGTIRNIYKFGISLRSINDVFLTHRHADHISGISHFLFLKMLHDPQAKVRVFGPKQTLKAAKNFAFDTHDLTAKNANRIAFIDIYSGQEISLARSIRVRAVKVSGYKNSKTICFAYLFKHGGKKIAFTSDMSPNKNFEKLSFGSNIIIHECFGLKKDAEQIHAFGHSTAKDAGVLAQKAGAKKLILTHIGPDHLFSEIEVLREVKQYFFGKVIVAEDLMQVKV